MIHPLLCNVKPNFYPRSPCGERRYIWPAYLQRQIISIHALLAESDTANRALQKVEEVISIHALLAESDRQTFAYWYIKEIFLSTLSLRRATTSLVVIGTNCVISIHALLAESDDGFEGRQQLVGNISIHALLAESDGRPQSGWTDAGHFYPRSPCGERPTPAVLVTTGVAISIHALLAESDVPRHDISASRHDFYPRSPCGERLNTADQEARKRLISIHALLAESDALGAVTSPAVSRFLSTLSLRRATQ